MKKTLYIALLFFLIGCGTTLKNSWTNFRAYYNTYYNAKKSFEAGLDKIQAQPVEIDINKPLRVHPEPLNAGDEDFQKAIEKGAQILRKFPDSKWVDETLQLIGKSYYYRKEYYSALRKFEEQYNVTESPEMRQKAVIWKGRVLLDLELYDEGVAFLQDELDKMADEWKRELRGEAQIVLAGHQVGLQNWQQVLSLLQEALARVEKGPMKARAFFLYGQVLEAQERYGEAHFAYSNVTSNRPEFELLYRASLKRAEVLRSMGNLAQASDIYESMRKDDKNVQRLDEITYEIARTEEEKGNISQAEQIFKNIIRNETTHFSQLTRAKTYYRLGEIYTRHYENYQIAAAYYDSSSSVVSTPAAGIFSEDLNTETLARAYGAYSRLQNKIQQIDSLLWLGSLPAAKFDSVIAEIKKRRLQELKQTDKGKTNASNVLTNLNFQRETEYNASASGLYGFLNYRNNRLVTEAKNQFQAVWGTRALADNWRRIEAVRTIGTGSGGLLSIFSRAKDQPEQADETEQIEIDISEVPVSDEQRELKREELAIAKYELGNLFLLTLQMPDSAAHYFRSVVENHPDHALVPKALYSLYEVYASKNDTARAQKWAGRLRSGYPHSIYTRQLNQRLGYPQPEQQTPVHDNLQSRASRLASSPATVEIAEELRALALANKQASAAPQIHFEAIKQYIRLAKKKTPPVATKSGITQADSTGSDTIFETRYEGAHWDSVRAVLDEHIKNFSGRSPAERANKMAETLGKKDRAPEEIKSCNELGITPGIKPGMDEFLSTVVYPGHVRDQNVSGTVNFEFVINSFGEMLSYQLISKKTNLGIEEAFAEAIENNMEFLPLETEEPTKVRCAVSFPINLVND